LSRIKVPELNACLFVHNFFLQNLVWDERPPGEDDGTLPVRMDWSRDCGAEDTDYIPEQARPPAWTRACTEVPAEHEKAAGDVAAEETNKAAPQDSARAEKARERRRRKRSKQGNPRKLVWLRDHGRLVPQQAAPEQQAATEEEKKTGQKAQLDSIEEILAPAEARVELQRCSWRPQRPWHLHKRTWSL
jgi:hypothetical protein